MQRVVAIVGLELICLCCIAADSIVCMCRTVRRIAGTGVAFNSELCALDAVCNAPDDAAEVGAVLILLHVVSPTSAPRRRTCCHAEYATGDRAPDRASRIKSSLVGSLLLGLVVLPRSMLRFLQDAPSMLSLHRLMSKHATQALGGKEKRKQSDTDARKRHTR